MKALATRDKIEKPFPSPGSLLIFFNTCSKEEEFSMNAIEGCNGNFQSAFILSSSALQKHSKSHPNFAPSKATQRRKLALRACAGQGGKRSFLSLEEAGLVEISGLSTHERFLCRLTISSLNLLRVIAEQEECSIEDLNAGRVCDWFVKDRLKREQNLESAVLQWDDSDEFQF